MNLWSWACASESGHESANNAIEVQRALSGSVVRVPTSPKVEERSSQSSIRALLLGIEESLPWLEAELGKHFEALVVHSLLPMPPDLRARNPNGNAFWHDLSTALRSLAAAERVYRNMSFVHSDGSSSKSKIVELYSKAEPAFKLSAELLLSAAVGPPLTTPMRSNLAPVSSRAGVQPASLQAGDFGTVSTGVSGAAVLGDPTRDAEVLRNCAAMLVQACKLIKTRLAMVTIYYDLAGGSYGTADALRNASAEGGSGDNSSAAATTSHPALLSPPLDYPALLLQMHAQYRRLSNLDLGHAYISPLRREALCELDALRCAVGVQVALERYLFKDTVVGLIQTRVALQRWLKSLGASQGEDNCTDGSGILKPPPAWCWVSLFRDALHAKAKLYFSAALRPDLVSAVSAGGATPSTSVGPNKTSVSDVDRNGDPSTPSAEPACGVEEKEGESNEAKSCPGLETPANSSQQPMPPNPPPTSPYLVSPQPPSSKEDTALCLSAESAAQEAGSCCNYFASIEDFVRQNTNARRARKPGLTQPLTVALILDTVSCQRAVDAAYKRAGHQWIPVVDPHGYACPHRRVSDSHLNATILPPASPSALLHPDRRSGCDSPLPAPPPITGMSRQPSILLPPFDEPDLPAASAASTERLISSAELDDHTERGQPTGLSAWPAVLCHPPQAPLEHWPNVVSLIMDGVTSAHPDGVLWHVETRPKATYYLCEVEPHVTLALIFDGEKKKERSKSVLQFMNQLTARLRNQDALGQLGR